MPRRYSVLEHCPCQKGLLFPPLATITMQLRYANTLLIHTRLVYARCPGMGGFAGLCRAIRRLTPGGGRSGAEPSGCDAALSDGGAMSCAGTGMKAARMLPALRTVVESRRLTPLNQKESDSCRADRHPVDEPINSRIQVALLDRWRVNAGWSDRTKAWSSNVGSGHSLTPVSTAPADHP